MAEGTNIRVDDDTWQRLNARKQPGDSFNDVLERLLKETGGEGNLNPTRAAA
jgi:predicted CopG family antitoxin